jgi:hypothetical protein
MRSGSSESSPAGYSYTSRELAYVVKTPEAQMTLYTHLSDFLEVVNVVLVEVLIEIGPHKVCPS